MCGISYRQLQIAVCVGGLLLAAGARAQDAKEKLFAVDGIRVAGTHLPSDAVAQLSGIKLHDKVNDALVNAACHRITKTGLFKSIDYVYEAYPDRPGVIIKLTVEDETPALPATIEPAEEAGPLWSCLQTTSAIFRQQLPPTEKAIAFYSAALDKCLHENGHPDEYAASDVKADSAGKLTNIVFTVRHYKNTPAPH